LDVACDRRCNQSPSDEASRHPWGKLPVPKITVQYIVPIVLCTCMSTCFHARGVKESSAGPCFAAGCCRWKTPLFDLRFTPLSPSSHRQPRHCRVRWVKLAPHVSPTAGRRHTKIIETELPGHFLKSSAASKPTERELAPTRSARSVGRLETKTQAGSFTRSLNLANPLHHIFTGGDGDGVVLGSRRRARTTMSRDTHSLPSYGAGTGYWTRWRITSRGTRWNWDNIFMDNAVITCDLQQRVLAAQRFQPRRGIRCIRGV
jgi:hypothetical protein